MAKTTLQRQTRAAQRLVAAMTDGRPDAAERAVRMVVKCASGPFYRPYVVAFADVQSLLMTQLSPEYRAEIGSQLGEFVDDELMPSTEDLAQRITRDPRWEFVLLAALRGLLRDKLLELEADHDLTYEETVRRVDARLR